MQIVGVNDFISKRRLMDLSQSQPDLVPPSMMSMEHSLCHFSSHVRALFCGCEGDVVLQN